MRSLYLNRIGGRLLTAFVLLFTLAIGNAWGLSSTYYSRAGVKVASGEGTVYVKGGATSATTSSNDASTSGTSFVYSSKQSASSSGTEKNFAILAVPGTDYRFDSWALSGSWSTQPTETSASASGKVKCNTTSSSNPTTGNAAATFVQISIASVTPTSVTLNPTDARTSCTDYTGTVTFTTNNDNAAAQIGTPAFSGQTGSGTWTPSNSWTAGTSTVTYTFKGNGYYGGSGTSSGSRNNSATLTLPTAGGTSSQSVTFTANFPSLELSAGSSDKVYPATPTTDVQGTATFPVQYCDGAFDFTASISGASGGTWTKGDISVSITDAATGSGMVTVPFTFNAGGAIGDFNATLTLTPVANTGGSPQSITLTAHAEQVYDYDVEVYNASNVKISDDNQESKASWKEGLKLVNANPGSTIKLMRNVTVTAAQTFSKTATLELNGKTLSSTVDKMITINGTDITVTIQDSKSGGLITDTVASNATRQVISLAKGKLVLESGRILMYSTSTGSSVVAYGVNMASGTTFDMHGGTVESVSAGQKPYTVYVVGTFNMDDGELKADAGTTTAYALIVNNGTANVTGGKITAHTAQTGSAAVYMNHANAVLNVQDATLHAIADAENLTSAGNANAYGILNYTAGGTVNIRKNAKIKGEANNVSYGRYGYGIVNRVANCKVNILEGTGVEIVGYSHYQYGQGINNAGTLDVIGGVIKGETDALEGGAYGYGLVNSGTATIHGGEFKGSTRTSNAIGISSTGTTTIEDAKLTADATTKNAYGLYVGKNKTIATNTTIEATTKTTDAHGVYLVPSLATKTGAKSEPEAELNNVTSTAESGSSAASGVTALTARLLITSTASGYVPGDYVAKSTLTINGGTYTAIATTTTAYGAYIYKPAYIADGSEIAVANATINNATFIAKTTGANNNAYGIRTGGITTVNGCNITAIGGAGKGETPAASNVHGIIIDDQKTTVSNTTITSKGLTKAYGIYVNAAVFTSSADASRWPTYGYTFQGEVEVNGNNQITAQTTGGETAYGIYVHAAKANVASGVLAGDHATAGTAVVNGGKFNANASGTPAYAACVADPVVQGEGETAQEATPTLIINDGKFKGTAGATPFADVSAAGEHGYFVLNGGYYVKDENLDKKLGEEKNKVEVKSGTPEYTEGYRWRVTGDMTGEHVCKIVQNSTSYASLEEALQVVNASPSSTWTIVMIANYTLSKGDYEIPAKTTLIIPYMTSQTDTIGVRGKKAYPAANVETYEAPYPLYKLTFASGVNMTVKGTIEASAVTYMSNQGLLTHGTGIVSGAYGWLYLTEGSHIDLEHGSKLIAWGYVTGKGEINAKSGSKVYEDFQIGDWRGGSAESGVVDNGNGLDGKSVFVITHYYYQNIECPITYRPGAAAYGWGGTYMYRDGYTAFDSFDQAVPLINPVAMVATSDAMFCMSTATSGDDTWVRKEYNPETDYVNWTMNSGASLGSIRIRMNLPMIGNMDVTSSSYVLPITSNFNIIANYGNISLTNHVCFIPGSKLTIKKEATVIIPSGQRAFFYDQDDWKSFSGYWFYPGYSPSWKNNPRVTAIGDKTKKKMSDAMVLIEGTLDIQGAAYTTAGGANLYSTRENAGKVKFTAAAPASTSAVSEWYGSYPSNQNKTLCQWIAYKKPAGADDSEVYYEGKALNSVWLKNEDDTYTTTTGTTAGKEYVYMEDPTLNDGVYRWLDATTNGCITTVTKDNAKDYIHPSDWVAVEANANGDHAYHNEGSTRMFVNAKAATNASCVWWEVDPTPQVIGGITYYVANNENFDNFGTYFYWDNSDSYWKPKKVTVIWNDKDGNKITNGSFGDLYNFNTSPVFHGENPTWANSATEKHDWIGWRDPEGNIYDKNATLPLATKDTTYTAYFVTSKYQYTITFKNDDNSDLWAGLVDAGTTGPELQALFEAKYNEKTGSPVPTKAPSVDKVYTFSDWNTTLATVTEAATYIAHYTETTRQYHVTFYSYDAATVLYETDVDYNTRPVYAGVTPFRANTSAFSYEWTGWQQGANTYDTDDDLALVTGDIYYVATFAQTELKYQVFFKRQDGTIIDAPFFNYEETPAEFPANPTMASTVSTDYTFREWSPATLVPVTEDGKVYTALFDESVRQYTAHFVNYDGTSLNVDQTIDYNTVPAYAGATPFKPNDNRNSYEFAGWAWAAGDGWDAGSIGIGEAFPAIKGDITFTAQFNPVLLQFNVVFQHEDGTQIDVLKKKYGNKITISDAPDASKDATAQYTYTFDRWEPALTATEVEVTKDLTYTALFNEAPRSYSVTLNTNEGTINAGNVTSYTYGTGANLPTNVTRTGYDFNGWYDNSGLTGSEVTNISATATGNKTYWAKWTVHTHKFAWDFAGGSTSSTTHTADNNALAYGSAISYPADNTMTKTGYTFAGWSSSATTMPDEDLTITANWTINQYKVTFNSNGGSAVSTIEQDYNTAVTAPADPTREGYTFAGWSPSVPSVMPASNTECVAQWTINQYTISFDSNGGSEVSSITQDYNTSVTAPADPTKTGYTFNGWSPAVPETMPLNGLTCEAQWTANTYTVALDRNSGSTGATSVTMTYNSSTMDDYTAPTRTGYTFKGYYTSESSNNGSGTQVINTSGALQENVNGYTGAGGVWTKTTATTLYAKWSQKTYNITFYNGGHGTVAFNNTIVADGGTAKVYHVSVKSLVATADPGYDFNGWTKGGTNAAKVTIADASAASTTIKATGTSASVTANWTAHSYTISYDLAGGSVASANPTSYTIESDDIILNNPTREGYTFAGWTGTGLDAATTTVPIAAGSTGDRSYTATWTINQYTISFDSDGGSEMASITQDYNSSVTAPANPTKTGYTFTGWTPAVPETMPAENTTCVAQWTVNTHALTWNFNGGTPSGSYTEAGDAIAYGTAIEYPTVAMTGYTFAGWSSSATAMPDEDLAIEASWTPNTNTPYVVKHYQQNLDGTYPSEPTDTDNVTGTTDTEVTPEVKNYAGFTAPDAQTVTVLPDGSRVVTYQYTRKSYNLTWDANGGELSGEYTSGLVKFGAPITVPTATRMNYDFDGWDEEPAATMPAENKTYTAQWSLAAVTILWKSEDGTQTLETDNLALIGSTPSFDGATPTKATTEAYTYTFDGWTTEANGGGTYYATDAMPAVSAEATYYAHFAATANVASVTVGGATTYYATLQAAFNYAADKTEPTITVMDDITLSAKVTYTNTSKTTVTFDLNGHTISGAVNGLLTLTSGSSTGGLIIIKSGVAGGQIRNTVSTTSARSCVTLSKGKLRLESGTIYIKNGSTGSTYAVNVSSGKTFTMTGGTLEAEGKKNVYALYTAGSSNISGGTITVTQTSTNGYAAGVHVVYGTTTITDSPTITVSGTKYVNGVRVGGLTPAINSGKTAVTMYNGVANIEGGTYTITASSNTAYGVYCYGNTFKVDYATNATLAGNYANGGTANVSGGEFSVTSNGATAYGVCLQTPATIQTALDADGNATYDAATTHPKANITGGKFNVSSASEVGAVNTTATNTALVVEGGWYNVDDNLSGYVAPTKNCNYYVLPLDDATYKYEVAEAYNVTFNANGHGMAPDAQLIKKNGAVSEPVAPSETGYTFGGWNKETACTNAWNFALDVVTAATTLYAKWTINQYTVSFNSNGGSAVEPITQDYNTSVTAPADPTRMGYTFAGWTPAVPGTMPAENTECVAQWTVNTHALTWNFDGGTPSGSYTAAGDAIAYGTAITYPTLSKTGYTFAGWSSSATSMPDNDLTITASWTPNTNTAYTVKHYKENLDGTYPSEPDETDNLTGTTDAEVTPAVKSYTGFTAPSTQTVTILADGSRVVEYYYTRKSYTVTWNATENGGSCAISSTSVKYGATIGTLPEATKANHSFDGWYTTYTTGGNQASATTEIKFAITYYARFTPNTYVVTLNTNGGTINSGDVTSYTYGVGATLPTDVTRAGFAFGGWFGNSECTGDAVTTISTTATGNKEFWAKWTASQCTITWRNYNGDKLGTSTIQYGGTPGYTPLTIDDTPTRASSEGKIYEWDGWTTEAYGAGSFYAKDGLPAATGNTTYYAHFRIKAIDVAATDDIEINEGTTVETTIVHVQGALNVSANLHTDDLILEATPSSSGEITGSGTVNATNAYFHFSKPGGFKANTWYAVAVPWQVNVPAYNQSGCGVYLKKGNGEFVQQNLGSTFDLIYYDGERRAQGATKAWNYVEDDQKDHSKHYVMEPGRAYMIYLTSDADTIRFKKNSGQLTYTNVSVSRYSSDKGNDYADWNGIANPAIYKAYLNVGATLGKGQVYDAENKKYEMFNMSTNKLQVGQPIFVQSAVSGSVVVNANTYPSLAPRRAKAEESMPIYYEVMLAPSEEEISDRIIVRTDEDKEENAYIIGHDLAKMGVSSLVPQMWIERYGSKMCINTIAPVGNTADYPLGIFVPNAGEYDIFIDEQPDEETMLYLTFDGEAVWNLSYGGYVANLEKGNNTHYGLRIVRTPKITTGIDETTIQNGDPIRKVIIEDKVYIIRNNNVYSVDGHLAK